MDTLLRIKRLVLRGDLRFTQKALDEMDADGLHAADVVEAIVTAPAITKTLRSTSVHRRSADQKLYVIKGLSYDGTVIYTKGTIHREPHGQAVREVFYILISAKVATFDGR